MKTALAVILFAAVTMLGQTALAQVGAATSADQMKVENAMPSTECQGLLESFKHQVITYNSDTQSDVELQAQVMALMTDARNQAQTMNCAQTINMTVETVDVSTSYRSRLRQRMQRIVAAIAAAVNGNTQENLRVTTPIASIGIRG